ncbi:hypothetical protein [Alkalihalophilus marmarensis]|uniref:hypothetical protein n=1 Tax=Alkalihalophilus marmarensis TaxID=521377 RepID=UPI002E239F87|nr:hypothetical protein [Alkalihalophilus marmarensis]
MKWEIEKNLREDPYISQHVHNSIKFYEYPPTDKMEGIYIVIDPLDVPIPSEFADNQPLTNDYLYQVEVWSKNGELNELVAKRVSKVMQEIGFAQGSGVDEYDKSLEVFRDARQYRGKFYDQETIK